MDQNQKQTIQVTTSTGDIKVEFYVAAGSAGQNQCITISKNHQTIHQGTLPLESLPGVHPYSLNIWRHYEIVRRGHLVVRRGFGFNGCYGDGFQPDAPPNYHHEESDTEHASSCVSLLRSLQLYYPVLLTPECYTRASYLLKDHDLGENEYGDQLDDGSQNRDEKDRSELISFVLATAYLPPSARETAISDFIRFQDPLCSEHPPEIAHLVQLAKVIDKFEAVLSSAFYEKTGAPGNLLYKERHYGDITTQDRNFIREADGDSSTLAGWLVHTTHDYHMYYAFPYVLDIVKAAVIDIRGAWFPWFDAFCERNHIPKQHLTHPLLSS